MSKRLERAKESDQESRIQSLSLAERETVILKTGVDQTWTVYSCEKSTVNKLRRLASAYHVPVRELNFGGVEADLPLRAIALRGPSRRPPMTDEQKAAGAARLAAARNRGTNGR